MPPRNDSNDVDLSHVIRYTRDEFLTDVWDYKPSFDNMECVTVLAPMGGGKSYLMFQLLKATSLTDVTTVVLVMKPRDSTVSRFIPRLKFSVIRTWPPPVVKSRVNKPAGYVLWPLEHDDPDVTDKQQTTIFRRLMRYGYRKGNFIVVADEIYSLEKELNLTPDMRRIWTKGRSNGCGLWGGTQRPAFVSLWAYQAQHIFIGNDPDEETIKRLGQLGAGIPKEWVMATVRSLGKYEFCYLNREERSMCIVGA